MSDKLTYKFLIWFFVAIVFCFIVPLSFIHIPELEKRVIIESVIGCTLGYAIAIILFTLFEFSPLDNWHPFFKKVKKGIYEAYMYIVFISSVGVIAYVFFDCNLLVLVNVLFVINIFGLIYNLLKQVEWPEVREWLASVAGGFVRAYHIHQIWNVTVFLVYSFILTGITYKLIVKQASWKYYGWVLLSMLVLVINSAYEVWKIYKQHITTGNGLLKKKQKELNKAQAVFEKADKYLIKLNKDKANFQARIEKKLQENPDCPEADIDSLMNEIDRLDARIRTGEQIKQNLEVPLRNLQNEVQDAQNNNTEALENLLPLTMTHQQMRQLIAGERDHLLAEAHNRDQRHREMLREDFQDASIALREYKDDTIMALNSQLEIMNSSAQILGVIADERSRRKIQLAIQALETNIIYVNLATDRAGILNSMVETNNLCIRLMNDARNILGDRVNVLEETLRHISVRNAIIKSTEDFEPYMGSEGYPICPNCSVEHNNCGTEFYPYCSGECQANDVDDPPNF